MAVSQSQFDADLTAEQAAQAALLTAVTNYITAVDAFIALPPVVDLTNEDNTVNQALQAINTASAAVATAQGQIPPPPPATPKAA